MRRALQSELPFSLLHGMQLGRTSRPKLEPRRVSLGKYIQNLISTERPERFFEVRVGNHSRFITVDQWYRERKEKALIEYGIGRIGNSNQWIRIHPVKNERKNNE